MRFFDTDPLHWSGLSEARLKEFLGSKDRASYVLSTKIGINVQTDRQGKYASNVASIDKSLQSQAYDYTYDGVMRAFEHSLEQLNMDRIDILFAQDLDLLTHQSSSALTARVTEFMNGGYKALLSLRDQGAIKAIGAAANQWEPCQRMAEQGDFDMFLLSGRYTLLEQGALESFLPLCETRGIGVVIAAQDGADGLFAGPTLSAAANSDAAPEEDQLRVAEMKSICDAHHVRIEDAAFHFPLLHWAVVSVLTGATSVAAVEKSLAAEHARLPDALWTDLEEAGLIREGSFTKSDVHHHHHHHH